MVGVVVVTHGTTGEALLAAAARLAGPLPATRTVAANHSDTPETIAERIAWAAEQVDSGAGMLFLVDLAGSTPSNLCLAEATHRGNSVVLGGVNLPILLKLATTNRHAAPLALARDLEATGERSIEIVKPNGAQPK